VGGSPRRRPAGEGAEEEGWSRAASGPPALGALAAQIIRALEREAESGSRRRRRKSRGLIAFAPHLPGVPPPPSPTTRWGAAAVGAPPSCGPGRCRDHCSLAPARAPVPSAAAAASSAPPRRRAHDGAALPLPHPWPAPPRPAPPRPAGSAAATAAARRSSWRDPDVVGQELRREPATGEGRPRMTSLPYPASFAASRPAPQAKPGGSIRIPDPEPGPAPSCFRAGSWTSVRLIRASWVENPFKLGH
jgi:hypothetical protein